MEYNPVKAAMNSTIGEYRWTMSSRIDIFECLNYEFIESIDLYKNLMSRELDRLGVFSKIKLEYMNKFVVSKVKKSLVAHFHGNRREIAIDYAIVDGDTQKEIANYLHLSSVIISKIYRLKVALFNKLQDKGIFWSYDKEFTYKKAGETLLIEYLLKYGDFDNMQLGFLLFSKRIMTYVWDEKLKRFIKLNFMIARVFLGMDIETNYFQEVNNARFKKLKMFASQY